jgi:hypothetical protein
LELEAKAKAEAEAKRLAEEKRKQQEEQRRKKEAEEAAASKGWAETSGLLLSLTRQERFNFFSPNVILMSQIKRERLLVEQLQNLESAKEGNKRRGQDECQRLFTSVVFLGGLT